MAENKDTNLFAAAGNLWAAIIFVPVVVFVLIAAVFQAIAVALPFLLVAAGIGGGIFAVYKYQTSPFTLRRRHEREVLELLERAEAQQGALPASISNEAILARLRKHETAVGHSALAALIAPAQAIYREEFLRMLPPMPPAPLEAEKVYDDNYDRRTLKKGEEPPHRSRTDGKGRPTTLALEEFKAFLHRYVASTRDPAHAVSLFTTAYADFVAELCAHLPAATAAETPTFTVPLIDFIPNAKVTIAQALAVFWQPSLRNHHHFSSLRETFERKRQTASESVLREKDIADGKVVNPDKYPGSVREMLDAYLGGTDLYPIFLTPVPFALPTAKRFEGHWIVARQGSGKTNALECLIDADLTEVMAGRASVLVMDSQGTTDDTLLGRLSTLNIFGRGQPLDGKLIYLEPDLEFPLALNIFDIGLAEMGKLTVSQREDIVSSACEVVEFMFTGLLGGDLSDNMTMLYRYLVPAMLAIPNADMNTFIELLDSESTRERPVPPGYQKYRGHFAKLEPEISSFLETDYLRDPELVKTKAAVRRRLRAAMADTTFRRMFMQPHNKLNLFRELQSAKVILVNTYPAKGYVEQFGRLILALVMQATRQRLEIDRGQRMPTYLYIDECQDYIAKEERIAKYIDKCRKQNVGLIFSHQRLSNIENPKVRNALSGVSIKFAGTSDADDAELASLTATTPDHIKALPRGTFAAYVSGLTPHGIDLKFPRSPLESAPRMTKVEVDAMRAAMRHKYSVRYGDQSAPDHPPDTAVAAPAPPYPAARGARDSRHTPPRSGDGTGAGTTIERNAAPTFEDEIRTVTLNALRHEAGDDYDPLKQ